MLTSSTQEQYEARRKSPFHSTTNYFFKFNKTFWDSVTVYTSMGERARASQELSVQQKCRRIQHHTVTTRRQMGGDIPCGFQSPELQNTLFALTASPMSSRAGLSLRANDDGLQINQDAESKKVEIETNLLLLDRLVNQERRPKGGLLGNLEGK